MLAVNAALQATYIKEKPYACSQCSATSTLCNTHKGESLCLQSMQRYKQHTQRRNPTLAVNAEQQAHCTIHTKEKPYACRHCGATSDTHKGETLRLQSMQRNKHTVQYT